MNLIDILKEFPKNYIKNISCGNLRRIGKTTTIRQYILQYKEENPKHQLYILVPYLKMKAEYSDLIENNILNGICSPKTLKNLRGKKVIIISDEVKDAEYLCGINKFRYLCGLYSDCKLYTIKETNEKSN